MNHRKKILIITALLLTMVMICGCGGQKNELSSNAQTTPIPTEAPKPEEWIIKHYVDEFKNETDETYLTYSEKLKGTFSNSATTDSKLRVTIIVTIGRASFKLYEYGNNLVKNYYSHTQYYTITYLDDDKTKTSVKGRMDKGNNLLYIDNVVDSCNLINAMKANKSISIYAVPEDTKTTNYLFTINCEGFKDAYKDYTDNQ